MGGPELQVHIAIRVFSYGTRHSGSQLGPPSILIEGLLENMYLPGSHP